MIVSFAAVLWDVTQRSPQRNGCSHPNNIPFHCLTNHSFRSIFENLVAPNSPFETCPIRDHFLSSLLKLINYSCSSYPTRASYSGQVDGFRSPMKNELKTRPCLKPVFEMISNTDANFLNLHIDKATKTRGDKQLYLITHLTKQTLNLNYLLLKLNVTEQLLKNSKQKRPFFLNSRSIMATSCFGSLSTLLYTSDLK